MLAVALGMTSGLAFSAFGWILTAVMLFFTVLSAGTFASLAPLDMTFATVSVILAFNAGLCLGIVPRVALSAREAASQ